MLSRRLWRSIIEADSRDPIVLRVSQNKRPRPAAQRFSPPRWLLLPLLAAAAAAFVAAPQLLMLLFSLPIVLISLLVALPALLPGLTLLGCLRLTAELISGIAREKRQYTYDLLCASTAGALGACWSIAIGMAQRGGWLEPLHWGARATLWLGGALLAALSGLALAAAVAAGGVLGWEQARVLALGALLLALYASTLTQTIVLSLLCGLYASSFELSRADATFVGVFAYALLAFAPLALGALLLMGYGRLAPEAGLLARAAVECAAPLLVMGLRELAVALLWRALAGRLGWGSNLAGIMSAPPVTRGASA